MRDLIYKMLRSQIMTTEYKSKRLDKCNAKIVNYFLRGKYATTSAERKFCNDMVEMYKKRYNWYLK